MGNNLDPTNMSALQFNVESTDLMHKICSPILKKDIGVIVFTYCRIFNNGTRLYLCTCPEWVKHYISHNFQDNVEHQSSYAPCDNNTHSLWTGFKEDDVWNALRNHFNRWHGFSIYERHEDYIDSFDFTARLDCPHVTNYYLNNMEFLYEFIRDFKKNAATLMDPKDKRKLIVSKIWRPFEKTPQNLLLSKEKMNNFLWQTSLNSSL